MDIAVKRITTATMYEQIIPLARANVKKIDIKFNFAIPNGETEPKLVRAIPAKPSNNN